jgi:RNA polymerase sigma factor (sigma-70 family)
MRMIDSASAESALEPEVTLPEQGRSSDETALQRIERLFREQNSALVRVLHAILHDWEGAQEVAQEAYEEIYKREKAGVRIAAPRNYLFKTGKNLALNRLRERSQRSRHAVLLEQIRVPDAPSAEQQCIRQQESKCLEQAIQELPPRAREAFTLVRIEGISPSIVAQRMGVEPNTVRQLCSRANVYLMKALAEFDGNRGGRS